MNQSNQHLLNGKYTAEVSQTPNWWIGWVEEVPGVNAQERTEAELLLSLQEALRESLEMQSAATTT